MLGNSFQQIDNRFWRDKIWKIQQIFAGEK